MKTLVVVIEQQRSEEYPIDVYFDDGTVGWRAAPAAAGTIAAGLTREPFIKRPDGKSLNVDTLIDFLQTEDRPTAFWRTAGDHLWSLFETTPVGPFIAAQWSAHAKKTIDDGKPGIRMVLDVRAPELRRVPWELMVRNRVPMFASPLNPTLRGPLAPTDAPAAQGMILKVLVVIGSKPDDDRVKAEEERDNLLDAARKFRRGIDLHVLSQPTEAEFFDEMNLRPHVLHFTGHAGEFARGGPSSLIFFDKTGRRWDWTTEEIGGTLAKGAPRLVILNACRTAASARGDVATRAALSTLSDSFLDAGALAVVAMQADIAGTAAADMAGAAYRALAVGEPLDIALAEARLTARQRSTPNTTRDWALPSLEARVQIEDVLPKRLKMPDDRRSELEAIPEFVAIVAFVDRRPQRRRVDPLSDQTAGGDVLTVDGPASIGKTSMLSWFLEGCAWCGHRIKHVDLSSGARPGFLDVIERIIERDVNYPSELRNTLPGDFSRVRQLAAVVRGGSPAAARTPDDPIDALFGAFRAALVAAAGGQTLIIALDHLGRIDPTEFRNYLRPYLLDYVVQRRLRPVRFVLACNEEDLGPLNLATLEPVERVTLGKFAANDFEALYREYLAARNVPRGKIPAPSSEWRPVVDFPPDVLRKTYDLLKSFGKI